MTAVSVAPRTRVGALDALRGLAILLMVGDHLAYLFASGTALGDGYRLTLGRAAMPLFFVLAGHLAGRLSARHLEVGIIGVILPLAVPWIDAPNVLVWWALGCLVLHGCDRLGVHPGLLVAVGLTLAANGWDFAPSSSSYGPFALLGLMALGRMIPRPSMTWAAPLPGWVAGIGRHPIGWYVGHLLALHALGLGLGVV